MSFPFGEPSPLIVTNDADSIAMLAAVSELHVEALDRQGDIGQRIARTSPPVDEDRQELADAMQAEFVARARVTSLTAELHRNGVLSRVADLLAAETPARG